VNEGALEDILGAIERARDAAAPCSRAASVRTTRLPDRAHRLRGLADDAELSCEGCSAR
jgi:hypothetical protein